MPRNKYIRNSPIESFRNHIPCGNLSCKNSCDHNSLHCIVCLKFFHYKCKGLSQTAYHDIITNNVGYICSRDCLSATLPFFDSNEIEFLDTITHHDNLYPCKKCKLECLDKNLMNCIECEVCNRWCHESCADLKYDFEHYTNEFCDLFWTCSNVCNRKLLASVLPFCNTTHEKIDEFFPFRDNFLCKKCWNNCMTDCVECDECSYWLHFDCAGFTIEEFDMFCNGTKDYFCSKRCLLRQLPFHSFSGSISEEDLPCESSVVIDGHTEKISNNLNTSDDLVSLAVNNNTSLSPTSSNPSNLTSPPIINTNHNMHSKPSRFQYYRQFLDLNCSYLCPNDLEDSFLSNDSSEFVVYHNNVRSFKKNMQSKINKTLEIFQNCSSKLPDILAFSDTQVNDNTLIPPLDGYHDFEFSPTPTGAGGVGFYLRETLDYVLCPGLKLNLNLCEDIWLRIKNVNNSKFESKGLIIGIIYRHGQNYTKFCERLCECLLSLNEKKEKYIIVGDFNLDLMKYNLIRPATHYLNAINSVGCNALIDKPTRITSDTASCIDHALSNLDPSCFENHIILSEVSDHFGTLSKVGGISKVTENVNLYFRKSNLSDKKWAEFDSYLQDSLKKNVPLHCISLLNANFLAQWITNSYRETIDKFMPLKKRKKNQKRKPDRPWITSGIKASIAKMFELLSICKHSRLPEDFQKYKSHLKILDKVKAKAENDYYKEKSELYGRDKSKTWQLVNEITSYKKKKSTIIKSLINKSGKLLTDPTDIANSLNDHFGSIGSIMAQKFDNIDNSRLKDPLSYISKDVQNSLFLHAPNSDEISKDINKLADTNSCSYDLVSNRTLKATNKTISPYLEILFYKCIAEGVFPDSFKIAQVIPLFKGGKKDDQNCYRPISLLPSISKLFERILARRLIKFLTKYDVLSKDQFGFRAKFSTEYAIADIHDKLIKNLDEGLHSCAIFLDLAKAFDSVSHNILLRKLKCYGIRGKALDLFSSYLTSRSQFVKLPNGTKSSLTGVDFGVPQGSILGPILFLLFINDLTNASEFYIKLFADDTFLCSQNSNFTLLQNEVNFELEKVYVWLASNKLTLNMGKSKFMLITKKRKVPKFSVKIDSLPLKSCEYLQISWCDY